MPAVSSDVSWTADPGVAYDFGSMPQAGEPRADVVRAREILGLTQESLAARAGVSVRTVARFEAGEPINLQTAKKLAPALGVPLSFITDPDAAPPPPRLAWGEFRARVLSIVGKHDIAPEAEARLRFAYDEIVRQQDSQDR